MSIKLVNSLPQLTFVLYFYKHFYNGFFPHFTFVCCVVQTRWIVQEDQKENLAGSRIYISRTAWEVQRFPTEVIKEIIDQELLLQLAELVEQQLFIVGREIYNSPKRNRLNK